MATGKRYYWIKLKESFMNSDTVDYLMGLKDGANYVVLYQMLCLKTINTEGRLSRQIGEVIIPYDVEKIHRDCKWFSVDTIRVALELYRSFGLIYEDVDGTLVLTDHQNLVGSETDWAEKRRRQRLDSTNTPNLPGGDNVPTNVPTNVPQNVPIDIRDKDIRDISTEEEEDTRARGSEEKTAFGRVMSFYLDKVNATPSPAVIEGLKGYLVELDADVILHAFGIALDEHKTGWSYIRGILRRYARDGLTNMPVVLASEQEYQQRKDAAQSAETKKPAPAPSAIDNLRTLHQMFSEEEQQ